MRLQKLLYKLLTNPKLTVERTVSEGVLVLDNTSDLHYTVSNNGIITGAFYECKVPKKLKNLFKTDTSKETYPKVLAYFIKNNLPLIIDFNNSKAGLIRAKLIDDVTKVMIIYPVE